MTARVVIAARGGPDAKRRCADALPGEARAALVRAMLSDMLVALAEMPELGKPLLVTPTDEVAVIAAQHGVEVLHEHSAQGLAAALRRGQQEIARRDPQALVVLLPGDLPLLDPAELFDAVTQVQHDQVGIVAAAADGGTGALLLEAGQPFAFSYGEGSCERHLAAARLVGLQPRLINAPSLAFDVDRPADVAALADSRRAPQTRRWLAEHLPIKVSPG